MTNTKKLVREAKRNRINRAYYEKYSFIKDLREAGFIQDEEKTRLERVQMEPNSNELIYLFAFDQGQRESQFHLRLTIVSLYPSGLNGAASEGEAASAATALESRWRLAKLQFKLVLQDPERNESTTYSYAHEQLIDYQEKRENANKHEHRNIYKVGSMSIEQVLPYSMARVLFNGLMEVRRADDSVHFEPMRLAISTHPTSDKFDYTYRFDVQHTSSIIDKSLKEIDDKRALLNLALEDRFDQPLMFQGHLESLQANNSIGKLDQKFVFWGAKVKQFLDVASELDDADDRDCLFAWTEFGQQIHLSRPKRAPNLVCGLIHNSFDYSSHLYDAKLYKIELGEEKEVEFSELESFSELASNYRIKLRGFIQKSYTLEVCQNDFKLADEATFKVKLNGFDGMAMRTSLGLASAIRAGQSKLLSLDIGDSQFGFLLASEQLLGGKGNSLMDLARLVDCKRLSSSQFSGTGRVEVRVPRGLVVSTRAYQVWLESNGKILAAIEELDLARRTLAAKSVHLNPMSSEYLSLSARTKILREKCAQTSSVLKAIPLPNQLKNHIYSSLTRLFGKEQLEEKSTKLFAVRSSAVGEDSLETSAAGQMKTVLGARGFQSICQAIVECWTSQFELEAATYKSQNGLEWNLPMAVVVQELVSCHVAGVAATCEPLSGNQKRLEITANLGLGEGVVSGKKTDTVRVSLDKLAWHEQLQDHVGRLKLPEHSDAIQLLASDEDCCLSKEQIVALANLLLELRRASTIKEREVEWGITLEHGDDTSSSSSSSSDSSSSQESSRASGASRFRIHLLQSRPLTNLQRLSTREIEHELDYGFPCARDIVSRANIGEVMPGALCPLNSSYSMPVSTSYVTTKPYEINQSRKVFVADSSAFYAQMTVMVSTYSDTIRQIASLSEREQETGKELIYSMIGVTYDEPATEEERRFWKRFQLEKINPLGRGNQFGPALALALHTGWHTAHRKLDQLRLKRTMLQEDLARVDELARRKDLKMGQIYEQIQLVYKRITTETETFCRPWLSHIQATFLSIMFNYVCLKMLNKQPAYASENNLVTTEILNDFSALMREPQTRAQKLGKHTESGDVSRLLDLLLKCLVEENLLDQAKTMDPLELYNFFNNTNNSARFKCCKLYRDFMKRNGHRAFREFCLSTITWSDDSSYIMRLLAMRLKSYTVEEQEKQEAKRCEMERQHEQRRREIEAKISSLKVALLKVAFPQARLATTRRECTKSLLIKTVHKFRLAFRHLGGLLCLAGFLPSAELVFWLSIEELDDVVKCCTASKVCERNSLMPRLLYKARRRQQRARAFDEVKFPKPTLTVNEMFQAISEQTEQAAGAIEQMIASNQQQQQQQAASSEQASNSNRVQVSGLISCAGRVTGRACVVTTIDQMDQVQQGDILITYSTDISWTVYYFALAGIVTELGGIVSHGAVVAREYGIPTLCTAIGACTKFQTGQIVTLDATAGVCYLSSETNTEGDGNGHA